MKALACVSLSFLFLAGGRLGLAQTLSFSTGASVSVGRSPQAIVPLSAGASPDLACATWGDATLTVLTNDGHGALRVVSSPAAGNFPVSLVAADFKLDGQVDLACANYAGNSIAVLTNTNPRHFAVAFSVPVGTHPLSLVAADVNGDGLADLICAN